MDKNSAMKKAGDFRMLIRNLRKQKEQDERKQALALFDVGTRLFGVYSPEEDLLAVHLTEQGAEENKANYEKHHGEGFYVDYVMLQP